MEKSYSIAGLHVRITGGHTAEKIALLPGFTVFESPGTPNANLCIITDLTIGIPREMKLLHAYSVLEIDQYFYAYPGGYLFEMRRKDGSPVVAMTHDPDTNTIYMTSCDCELSLKFAVWLAYSFVAVRENIIPIHAAAIVKSSEAVLFLGESGTGKSTHTRLWIRNIQDSHLLNDDCPLVRVVGNRVLAYGSPWSGKTHCYHSVSVPVKAIVRLSQAPENRIGRHTRLHSIGAVYPSCPPVFAYDERLAAKILATIDRLITMVPVYSLACRPDREAAEMAYGTLYS